MLFLIKIYSHLPPELPDPPIVHDEGGMFTTEYFEEESCRSEDNPEQQPVKPRIISAEERQTSLTLKTLCYRERC